MATVRPPSPIQGQLWGPGTRRGAPGWGWHRVRDSIGWGLREFGSSSVVGRQRYCRHTTGGRFRMQLNFYRGPLA